MDFADLVLPWGKRYPRVVLGVEHKRHARSPRPIFKAASDQSHLGCLDTRAGLGGESQLALDRRHQQARMETGFRSLIYSYRYRHSERLTSTPSIPCRFAVAITKSRALSPFATVGPITIFDWL